MRLQRNLLAHGSGNAMLIGEAVQVVLVRHRLIAAAIAGQPFQYLRDDLGDLVSRGCLGVREAAGSKSAGARVSRRGRQYLADREAVIAGRRSRARRITGLGWFSRGCGPIHQQEGCCQPTQHNQGKNSLPQPGLLFPGSDRGPRRCRFCFARLAHKQRDFL